MCYVAVGIAIAAASAAYGAYQSTETQNAAAARQQASDRYQAAIATQNANRARADADVAQQQTNEELRDKDLQRQNLRREYDAAQGKNLSLMASSGTDISSGSAFDVLSGNADIFAADMGEALRDRSYAKWSGENKVNSLLYDAKMYDTNATYLSNTQYQLGNSLLNAGIAGVGTGASMFATYKAGQSSGTTNKSISS